MPAHPLVQLLQEAKSKLAQPKIKINYQGALWTFKLVTKSQKTERINGAYVTRGGDWIATLLPESAIPQYSWYADTQTKEWLETLLHRLSVNPREELAAIGKETSCCCFCGLDLTNEGSIHHGYGPICADKYNLPWSDHYDGDAPAITDLEPEEDF